MPQLVKKTVRINLTTEHGNGDSKFLDMTKPPKIVKSGRTIIQEVEHHYIGGKVRTKSGDCWTVILNDNQKESTYIAVRDHQVNKGE